MFTVKTAFKFLNGDGSQAKEPIETEYADLTKNEVIQLEKGLIQTLAELNHFSETKQGQQPGGKAIEVQYSFHVTEDGKKWTAAYFEWPNQTPLMQDMLTNMADVNVKKIASAVHAKGKQKGKKK